MLGLTTTPRSRQVTVAGCTVHVLEWGRDGDPALLLLHGGMAHARWWDPVADRLADRVHVFAADLPGHGDSPWIEPQRYGEVELPVIAGLVDALASGPCTVGGHSNGGLLAVLAATDGVPVGRLVLVDIPLEPATPALLRSGQGFRRMPQPCWATRDEAVAAFRLYPRDGDPPADVLRHVAVHSIREREDGGWTSKFDWRYFRGRDPEAPSPYRGFQERLTRIPCPTLVIRGGRSAIQNAADHAEIVARIPDARGALVPGAGHNPHVERPDETAAAIAQFVAR